MEESSTQASTPSKKPLSKEQLLKYIKQLKAQNKKLEDEIEGLKASGAPDEKRVASLEEVLASKQRQLEDEQAKNEQITKELLKTDTNFQESLAKIQELQGGFEMMREKLEGQVMALTSELASAKNINSELERKCGELQNQSSGAALEAEHGLIEMTKKTRQMEQETQKLEQGNKILQETLEAVEKEKEKLEEKLSGMEEGGSSLQ
eukprot:CAMPEP_0194663252 /NCGR_PEP_ID=MMETSP0295-20121207/705_1 /TAXON_ID=39354 /ORGANISM="Heterosigma akashiwo, Strain CCMP2393" /LENGTH=205 /DNA_ID=CAMNT_0039544667 /DNA_START=124 /DNA_END=738 /DNA_ORIENTATION=-